MMGNGSSKDVNLINCGSDTEYLSTPNPMIAASESIIIYFGLNLEKTLYFFAANPKI